jgi:hypothetical protein
MSKPSLTANWMRNDLNAVPQPLKQPLIEWRTKRSSKPYIYQSALLAIDTPLQHWAHVIYCESDKSGLVTWTGKGVRVGSVVMVSGPLEAIKRKIENYQIASVPMFKPFKTGHKSSKSEPKPLKIGRNSPTRLLTPPTPTSRETT